ncbi:MAG: DUF1330 domain-containing protein [Bacteroidota bacterium]
MIIQHIHPTSEQLQALAQLDQEKPIVMLNLLRFKELADDGQSTGAEAYARYAKNVQSFLAGVGGKLMWAGTAAQVLIGDPANPPHKVLLVEYPSVQHFLKMATDPEYLKVAHDRTIALEYGGLVACFPDSLPS